MYRFARQRDVLLIVFGLLSTSGCTMIGHEKVSDWPELQVREHYVAHHVMRDKCSKYVAFGMSPEACAEFNLYAGTCDIWYSADFPPGKGVVEHERLHCRGYDHIGGNVLRQAVAAWKSHRAAASSASPVDAVPGQVSVAPRPKRDASLE